MSGTRLAVDAAVVVSVVAGLPLTIWTIRLPASDPPPTTAVRATLLAGPGWWLTLVVTAIYLNQLLVNVYVIRVHDGDPSFIARYLPPGWFALAADNGAVQTIAEAFPAPQLLAASVLRVPALLELPLVVLGYLCLCRWFDRRLYQRLASPAVLALASASYTVVFCAVEWSLHNPYTRDDLVLRTVAAVLTPPLVGWLARRTRAGDQSHPTRGSALDLAIFAASAGAVGYLLLVVYDTALLYNLGNLAGHAPGVLAATAVLVATRLAARRREPRPSGVGIETLRIGLAWFIALFFVPALAIRYSLVFVASWLAVTAGLTIVVTAIGLTAREIYQRLPQRSDVIRWLAQSAVAVLAGVVAGVSGLLIPLKGYPEARLLLAAALAMAAIACAYAITDRIHRELPVARRSR